MSHGVHAAENEVYSRGAEVVLFDDCDRCYYHSRAPEDLDNGSLKALADLAFKRANGALPLSLLTGAEAQAIARLRLYARTVFASGITEEVAR